MNWVERTRRSNGDLVYLVRGKDEGRQAWYYVLVDRPKLPLFLARIDEGNLDLEEYGEVLFSGWGQDPPDDIVARIKAEYS